jgi:hypothetical protein
MRKKFVYTLRKSDIGSHYLTLTDGRVVESPLGLVQPYDIGKMIFETSPGEFQAENKEQFWDFEAVAVERMRRLIPGARCTYFPAEGWRVHVSGRMIGGSHDSKTTAIAEAIKLQIY